jgi:acetyl-CoA acetyltransferase
MSSDCIKDKTAIVGIGETTFGKGFAASEEHLACRAIKMALDDAGIDAGEVDALCSFTHQSADEDEIARNLGFNDLTFFARGPAGGGAGCGTVGHAAMAIATRQATVAVAYRSRKRSAKASRLWSQTPARVTRRDMWCSPWGNIRPVDQAAMLYRRYMHEFGATREPIAEVALSQRANANRNPRAFMRDKTLTKDQYMNARWISEPLCLFDCCLETDGALAAIVVSAERAKDCNGTPVYVHSFAQGISRGSSAMFGYFAEDPFDTQAHAVAKLLWKRSDFQPKDIKVAEIYDAFSPEILFSLEGFGFCKRGEAARFIETGGIRVGGRLPVNTAGGGLSEAYLHGFNMITEAVKQVRGTAAVQVPNVDCAFASSSDGVPTGALILRR